MNIALISEYNTSNVPYMLMKAINEYTDDCARLICRHEQWRYKDYKDIILDIESDANEAADIIKNADIIHIFDTMFNFAGINIRNIMNRNNSLVQYLYNYTSRFRGDIFRFHVSTQIIGVCCWSAAFWQHVPSPIYHITQMFDYSKVKPINPWKPGDKVVIAHAPTNRQLKGSEFFIQAIEKLKAKGRKDFEFILIENKTFEEALTLKSQAHIYLEELNMGAYSMNSVECMAMGQTVFCYLDYLTLSYLPNCPIVNVNKYNIVEQLERFLDNPTLINDNISRNLDWVIQRHDPEKVVKQYYYLYRYIKYQHQG